MLLAGCRESSILYGTVENKESCLDVGNPPLEVAGDVNKVSRLTLANRFRYYSQSQCGRFLFEQRFCPKPDIVLVPFIHIEQVGK